MEPLLVDLVNFYPEVNAKQHHTIKYESVHDPVEPLPVLRRGLPIKAVIRFQNRQYDENVDLVQFVFSMGDRPSMETRGVALLSRNTTHDSHRWTAMWESNVAGTNDVMFEVSTPVTAPVGAWTLQVVTALRRQPQVREVYESELPIYLLFNPWHADDITYMPETELLEEYIQQDVGKVWVGPIRTTRGKPWIYGQFAAHILPACMLMLDREEMPHHMRGDPIRMSRAISKIVNANDDGGVLVGRWDGNYEDGTAPSEWTGSAEILQQFLETGEPVLYGQCWVFAGVVTTVCRALGIPSRVVSNLVSAHDANGSLSLDLYYTENMDRKIEGDPTNPGGADSVWNYHVWNDVWMARPDLPKGYGGWQAVDATPQETSDSNFQCGPASLEAIKQGNIGLRYDVPFMLASVNADYMRWRVDPYSESGYSVVDTNSYYVGRMILTKKPYMFDPIGDTDRQDITLDYKHRENTESERAALMNGVQHSARAKRYYEMVKKGNNDVKFSIRDIETVPIGEPFRVSVDMENTSDEPRTIKAALSATSVYYNGVKAQVVKSVNGPFRLEPKKVDQISILVEATEYLPKLVEYCNMKISAMALVEETNQSWADDDDFQFTRPDIVITLSEYLMKGEEARAMLSFTNPLDVDLSEGEVRLSSPGIKERLIRMKTPSTGAKSALTVEAVFIPNKSGNITFVATFKCPELHDITGSVTAQVYG